MHDMPPDEAARLEALRSLEILDTAPEPEFDALARAAAAVAACPIAMISLIDADRMWAKAVHGIGLREVPRTDSICTHTILRDEPLLVGDLAEDRRFAANPLVDSADGLRFYLGQPVRFQGRRLGTLCVMDRRPRHLSAEQVAAFVALADAVSVLLASRPTRLGMQRNDALLRKLGAEVPGLLFQFRRAPDGHASFPFVSDAIRAVQGLAPEALRDDARPLLDRLHPEDRERVLAGIERSAESLQVWHDVFRIASEQEGVRWREGHATPERLPDGTVLWHGYSFDATERKADELRLIDSEQRAELAIAAARIGISDWRSVDRMVTLDAVACELYGFTGPSARISVSQWLATIVPEDRDRVASDMIGTSARHAAGDWHFRVARPDGGVRYIELRTKVHVDAATGSLRIVSASRDQTEHVEATRARRAKEAAEQANRTKTEFLARVSHELRTPLNAIIGFAQLLGRSPVLRDSADLGPKIGHVEAAGRHLLGLIDDLLDLTREEVEQGTPAIEAVDVIGAIDRGLALVEGAGKGAGIAVRRPARARRPQVLADRRRLAQCLMNLLTNAIKYNRPGGHVWIDVHERGDEIAIEVGDTGLGMSPDQLARLFEPFNRVGAERSGIEGSGLGLVITKTLAERMNGRLTVESVPGQGSIFTLVLPAAPAQRASGLPAGQGVPGLPAEAVLPGTETRAPTPDGEDTAAPPHGAFDSARELVYVEDNRLNQLLMEGILADRPAYALRVVETAEQCSALLHGHRPDLLLIDLHLPDGSGIDLLEQLRSDPLLAGVPAVAVSADALPDDIGRARAAGFDDYWVKPLNVDATLAALDRMLAGARSPDRAQVSA
jgi:signal transduction histidine kinase/CheY-like chemotaxis protein